MLSRLISLPFILAMAYFGYMLLEGDDYTVEDYYAMGFGISGVLLVVIQIFAPQIDWYYYLRYPPALPEGIQKLLHTRYPFYQQLGREGRTRFKDRVALYLEGNDFKGQGIDEVPYDVQAIIAISAVRTTFHQEDFMLSPFERIIVYPGPFPSPQIMDHWHTSELYEEDGVLLFSAEQVVKSFFEPTKYFNIVLYEYVKALKICHPKQWPSTPNNFWEQVAPIHEQNKEWVLACLGLSEEWVDTQAVMITLWMSYPAAFSGIFPSEAKALEKLFAFDLATPKPLLQ